jgi:phosphatidylglycerophosphatase A
MAWYVLKFHGPLELAALGGILFLIGCWSSGIYARRTNENDPGTIVIDEVAAQCLVLTAVPTSPAFFIMALVAFRIADIFKPWPASWADRSVKGGFGIMLDDLFAAAYAWAFMYAVVWILD